MQAPFSLTYLRKLRQSGQAPSLPVVVTCRSQVPEILGGEDTLAIQVRPEDAEQNWSALAGLEVILDVPDRRMWTPLMRALRDCKARRFRCFIDGDFSTMWYGRP